MRYAMIMAGGSGTRLWPMSRAGLPKQLIPVLDGKSLLQLAVERLHGLVPQSNQYICASQQHKSIVLKTVPGTSEDRYYGEPVGRDTLNAVGLVAAEVVRRDPDAVIAVFTADHVIQPVDQFQKIVEAGFALAENSPSTLVTFGVTPTQPATGYGYLELAGEIDTPGRGHAFKVSQFKEKPDARTAGAYVMAGPRKYLWNSGMFVWRAATLMDCIARFVPENHQGLSHLASVWNTPGRDAELAKVYPTLPKISVDYAIMEPASRDAKVSVAAVPMPLQWLDVGSWPSFSALYPSDEQGNSVGHSKQRCLLLDTHGSLIVSHDPNHLIATIGCEKMIVVHTADATLVCRADKAEDIKKLHSLVGEKFGKEML